MGHEVVISAFYGLAGQASVWNGIQILPGAQDIYGNDIIKAHYDRIGADLLITLMDVWVVNGEQTRGMNMVHWHPVDCDPLSEADQVSLRQTGARSIAMSKFGKRKLEDAGYQPLYAPHAIDTSIFKQAENRDKIRKDFGVEGKFVIGINSANKDAIRKSYAEQFWAFARFHARHPDSVLLVHAATAGPQALDLPTIARKLGMEEHIRFTDQYAYLTGLIGPEHLANWYSALDLFSCPSHGEGFGIPIIEAQSCGTPVVVTDCTAMSELCGSGWKVKGEPFWNSVHQAWWTKPHVAEIEKSYEKAYDAHQKGTRKREQAREFALQYDVNRVEAEYWKPIIEELEKGILSPGESEGIQRIGPGGK
jgi:glycosyltransferase involved in cell wall biosynthesis